ncbi:MAG: hypothetical protein R3B45_13820 [Bdellovibrionota bacterium]
MNHGLKQTNIKIASRGSTLALWQANYVKSLLKEQDCQADISVIKTTGDKIQNRFLHEIGGKGLFVKEIEQALLEKMLKLLYIASKTYLPLHQHLLLLQQY